MKAVRSTMLALVVLGVRAFVWGGAAEKTSANPPKFWQSTEAEDYTIDRKEVFEFTKKPAVTRDGDRVTIRFASKEYCDATVAIENATGRIVRHLASGVLGPKAPEPFQPNALEQTVMWDGKDDLGTYLDDKNAITIRVSLGLKARFEKTLFWHPKKRVAMWRMPDMVAEPEGVYVYEGGGIESIKLFSHQGKYIRTVYPFPADKVKAVKGLGWSKFGDGYAAPEFLGYYRCTYLMGGTRPYDASWGTSAEGFAVHSGLIASVSERVCRLKTDGSTGDFTLYGPPITVLTGAKESWGGDRVHVPKSAAFSPDGQWLYLTGDYAFMGRDESAIEGVDWPKEHVVYRMEFAANKSPERWLGGKPGRDETSFNCPSSLCVDAQGRVYVADHWNDRVQIFSPDGRLLKSLPVNGPAEVRLDQKTQELYVFSWTMSMARKSKPREVSEALRVFDPFKSDQPTLQVALPMKAHGYFKGIMSGPNQDPDPFRVCVDGWTTPATVWMCTYLERYMMEPPMAACIQRWVLENGKWKSVDHWNEEAKNEIVQWVPPSQFRQRLHVDPRTGMLYVHEGKSNHQVIRIDPESGRIEMVQLPFTSEDLAIDYEGHVLLRCAEVLGRFTLDGMREVPFDYGEECRAYWSSFGKRSMTLVGGLVLPGNRPVNWIESGLGVNPKGEIVVSACNSRATYKARSLELSIGDVLGAGKPYAPQNYPGRYHFGEIHIFDKYGKPVGMDIVGKGAISGSGTLMDAKGDVYFLMTENRRYGSKDFFNDTGSLIKFKRGRGRFLCDGAELSLGTDQVPDVPPQFRLLNGERLWLQDAEWVYPGVGFTRTYPCNCHNSRFALDSFGRSFAPETVRSQIAVLDTNGNLILHLGQYGNVDDGVPLVEDQHLRTDKPRSIGGDEVALHYTAHVATYTDRRLFIADNGNECIRSVVLGYHAEEKVALKDVKDVREGAKP